MNKNIILLYSQTDEKWKERLEKHLLIIIKSGYKIGIDCWNETRIAPNKDWYKDFELSLNRSDVIVILASKSFFESGFMQSEKLRQRIKSKQEGNFPIFIIQIDNFKWGRFSWMKTPYLLPTGGRLLSDLSVSDSDSILSRLVEQIVELLEFETPVSEGILNFLQLNDVGPFRQLILEPGRRLNIITGDNSFGKSFLLECAWWALSGLWPTTPAYPRENAGKDDVKISFQYMAKSGSKGKMKNISYDWENPQWPKISDITSSTGLVIYARVDGSFAVWDPVRSNIAPPPPFKIPLSPLFIDTAQILEGIEEKITGKMGNLLCSGLLLDWINWQRTKDSPFALFKKLLEELSSKSLETLEPGDIVRLPGDERELPSICYPFGNVPFTLAAASVQRIISLAYLITWTWEVHKRACEVSRKAGYKNMTILIDEIESHLHPQWQRSIVPSLMEVRKYLDSELDIQFFITTHSPMVLSSIEPVFDEELDKLFHLGDSLDKIELKEQPFLRHGRVDNWFTSDTFGLIQARSLEGEKAIMDAQKLQQEKNPDKKEVEYVHKDLIRYLGYQDTFWPQWIYFAKQHGVDI
ncbi:MAG: AAA family ATPase [Candidatus Aminicenantes bacterium]|nr:AAA family ATPase [Candidatus Aminicenantes bacterium]